jgi:ribonuclease J
LHPTITFYGGIHEIGGNKFLIEDRGTRVFLDFGMQMSKFNQYFAEFVNPRTCSGMNDLFEFGLLPSLRGLYRKDYSKHCGFNGDEETEFDAVLITHAHIDHCAYVHYLRPEIPIYSSEATKLILQALQDVGAKEDYIYFDECFQTYVNNKGTRSRKRGGAGKIPRNVKVFDDSKPFRIDSIEVEPISVDHSLPGVSGFIVSTSNGSIGYTADLRFHGRHQENSERFVEECRRAGLEILLCEGTRIRESISSSESSVEGDVKNIVNKTKNLVVCNYPAKDLDRFLSFYNAAKDSGRFMVIDLKQAYILSLFQTSEIWKNTLPKPKDINLKIYIPRRGWGLIDKDINFWTKKLLLEDYDNWSDHFIDEPNAVYYSYVKDHQNECLFYCNDFQMQELIDIRPKENSSYIRSSTEPFNEEMKLDQGRVKKWLVHFGLIRKDSEWYHIHVSGHGSRDQLQHIVKDCNSKRVIPIHTENEEYYTNWHNNVVNVALNSQIEI